MSLLEIADDGNASMGLSFGLDPSVLNLKKTNRWMFNIPGVVGDKLSVSTLPPRKGARPGLNFKEAEFHHLHESIFYPLKAEWKTINLILYDIRCNYNAVFNWLMTIYDPSVDVRAKVTFKPVLDADLLKDASIELYDGCGNVMEEWVLEKCYPQSIDWGELDMDTADIVTANVVLRYQRGYFVEKNPGNDTSDV